MKKICICILITLFLFMMPSFIKADYDAVINGSAVNIRDQANTNGKSLYKVNFNAKISVVDKSKITGSGCSNGWYKIIYKNTTGYVCSTYVTFVDTSFEGIVTTDWTARVNANNISVREKADVASTKIDTLSLGVNVNILEEVIGKTKDCSNGKWYKIQYNSTKTGYMCASYVTKKSDITLVDNTEEGIAYYNSLKSQGFDDTYIPYLVYLHSKFPNWVFKAKKTNYSFKLSVDSEAGKNYMQTTNNSYRTSTVAAEGSSWFKVNNAVIAFYMDPRNWLNQERIFMFEKLDYSSELENDYLTMVKKIFSGGALADDKYTIPMVNTGKTKGISPLAIASRIRLEVGKNGSSSTDGGEWTWKGKTYSGYYNFFNIGAYEAVIDGESVSSVKRGMLYAAKIINREGELWNNIETAMAEGISFLADGYINNGQGTLYYQKFNVSPDAKYSSFTHQYMTNIQAPATEGSTTYNSYLSSEGALDNTFIFEIPVYNNMPISTSLPNSGNTDTNLSNISIDGYYLSPAFDEDILTYDVYVPTSLEKINISATAKSDLSKVVGTGLMTLESEQTDITITVTSEAGTTKQYVLTIKKVDDTTLPSQIVNASGYQINGTIISKIKNKSTVDSIQSILIKNGARNVIIYDKSNKQVNGTTIIGTGYKISITTGLQTDTFSISVNGDTSGDGEVTILDLLQVQRHIKKSSILSGEYMLAGDTSGDGSITILDLLQVQRHIKGSASL